MGGADNGGKNLFGGFNRRRKQGNGQRPGDSKAVGKSQTRADRTSIKTEAGRAEFESVRKESLNEKQKRDTAIAKAYGTGEPSIRRARVDSSIWGDRFRDPF